MARKYGTDAGHPVLSLALILFDEQKYEEAERLLRDGLQVDRGAPSPDNGPSRRNSARLGALLSAEGKFEQAEPMPAPITGAPWRIFSSARYDIAFSRTCLANSLSDQGKYAEADQFYSRAPCNYAAHPCLRNPGREWTMTCMPVRFL